jgi:integrase
VEPSRRGAPWFGVPRTGGREKVGAASLVGTGRSMNQRMSWISRSEVTGRRIGFSFASRRGTWLSPQNVRRQWRQARKDTGLEWVTPHTFRKTVATLIGRHGPPRAA